MDFFILVIWHGRRLSSPEEILSVEQRLQVKVIKLDAENKRVSLGLKQLQPEPWDSATVSEDPDEPTLDRLYIAQTRPRPISLKKCFLR